MKIYGYIYKITNLINNKIYIGQTTSTIIKRFKSHIRSRKSQKMKNMVLYKAFNKYGINNFIIEQIDVAYDQTELNLLEEYHIKQHNSLVPNGYNSTLVINCVGKNSTIMNNKISNSNQGLKKCASENKYIGVVNTKSKTFLARITKDKKCISLGNFNSEIEAAQAYDIKAIELYGENATLNFPELKESYINKTIIVHRTKHNAFGKTQNKIRKNKKVNIMTGIFYNKQNRWVVKKSGLKIKSFKEKEDAIKYLTDFTHQDFGSAQH